MVTVLADQHKVRFFGSPDLKKWETLSDFGPAGATGGVWECPDLFPLAVDGDPANTRWVLDVDINPGAIAGGSGGQYFVGTFDGTTFVNDNPPDLTLWADYGKDFYATLSFSDIPPSDGRRIWMAWISNWLYANEEPTEIWRGAQSVPRQLALRRLPDGHPPRAGAGRGADQRCATSRAGRQEEQHAAVRIRRDRDRGFDAATGREAGVRLFNAAGEELIIGVNRASRSNCSSIAGVAPTPFHEDYPGRHAGPSGGAMTASRSACCSIDRCSRSSPTTARRSITDRVYPTQPLDRLELLPAGQVAELTAGVGAAIRSGRDGDAQWNRLCGAVEAGGTKFVCMVGTGPDDMREQTRFPTTTPEATLRETVDVLPRRPRRAHGKLAAVGIASFGPVDLHPASPTFGFITSTPKPGWANVDIAGAMRSGARTCRSASTPTSTPRRWPSGAGVRRRGSTPSLPDDRHGHRRRRPGERPPDARPRASRDGPRAHSARSAADPFAGICPFHGDCLEGLASGPAMNARWLQPAEQLPDDHPGWALEARYLALALVNFICTLSPRRIVMGGGVMSNGQLFPARPPAGPRAAQQLRSSRRTSLASTTISSRHGWGTMPACSARWRSRSSSS